MRQLETARTTNNLNVENHAIELQFSFQIGLYLSLVASTQLFVLKNQSSLS